MSSSLYGLCGGCLSEATLDKTLNLGMRLADGVLELARRPVVLGELPNRCSIHISSRFPSFASLFSLILSVGTP